MAVYLFCTWFTSNFVLSFIVIILLSACDFWTVKNITGRLLVGLRWWNVIDENGNSSWKYESTSVSISLKNNIKSLESWTCWYLWFQSLLDILDFHSYYLVFAFALLSMFLGYYSCSCPSWNSIWTGWLSRLLLVSSPAPILFCIWELPEVFVILHSSFV